MSCKFPSKEDLKHYNNCWGCPICEYISDIFGHCSSCGILINKGELYYDKRTGEYSCENHIKHITDKVFIVDNTSQPKLFIT